MTAHHVPDHEMLDCEAGMQQLHSESDRLRAPCRGLPDDAPAYWELVITLWRPAGRFQHASPHFSGCPTGAPHKAR